MPNLRRAPLLATLALTTTALAQSPPPTPPPARESPALGGPKLASTPHQPTLIKRNFDGTLKRLDIPAEEAALTLLVLTEPEQQATATILRERAATLDRVVGDNIPLLVRLQGYKEGDKDPRQAEALRELTEKLKGLRERGRLRDELATALAPDNATQFERPVSEYWKTLINESTQAARAAGDDNKPAATVAREVLKAIGQEVKRSYDRQIAAKTGELDSMLAKVGATPEQDLKIRNLSTDYFQQTLGKPTLEQRREFFRSIMKELTPDQRKALLEELYGK